jgi:hypothetical protein
MVEGSIVDEGFDGIAFEELATVEEVEFYEEAEATNSASQALDESGGGGGGSSGGKKIVYDVYVLARLDRVEVHLDDVGAVLQVVGFGDPVVRELADFPRGNEPDLARDGDGCSEDEAATLDADNHIGVLMVDVGGEKVDDLLESSRIGEGGSDVFEENPGFGEVGNVSNHSFRE